MNKTINFDNTWETLLNLIVNDGASAAISHIAAEADAEKRNAWFGYLIKKLSFDKWPDQNIDVMVTIGEAAIESALNQSKQATEQTNQWMDLANIHCFNVSANLADCWQDDFKREARHFAKGLELANRAIEFREQLDKGPSSKAMAYWAKGKHLLSLKKYSEAEAAFLKTLAYDRQATNFNAETITADDPFSVLLDIGFLSLARMKASKPSSAEKTFQQVLLIFREWLNDSDKKNDAEVGLMELEESNRLN